MQQFNVQAPREGICKRGAVKQTDKLTSHGRDIYIIFHFSFLDSQFDDILPTCGISLNILVAFFLIFGEHVTHLHQSRQVCPTGSVTF